jgi:hypothetical protein
LAALLFFLIYSQTRAHLFKKIEKEKEKTGAHKKVHAISDE